eukprot:gnl/TRDRNA2_/TRDRNA2_188806_c0_seq1.p1 gnl/TRDRNA2_/TRDRNA2_188806_c0~~gnl/TRDRNA2_/TRDRNA2_188806_c0_seq1.p1  ORF type:complete len:270 (-),score=34.57 gnl/TRDRNA2_/TRDRNA2_188806_c0_seq1:133-942(-)
MSAARRQVSLPVVERAAADGAGGGGAVRRGSASLSRRPSSSTSAGGPGAPYGVPQQLRRDPSSLRRSSTDACGSGSDNDSVTVAREGRATTSLNNLQAVIFLDVDGVLHPTTASHPRQQFQAGCMNLLREVVTATGASIVLSTAWRLDPMARRIVGEKLQEHGLPPFVSRTPNIHMFNRAREVLTWVRKRRPLAWVAVDDWPLHEESDEMTGHFVQSRPRFGLTSETAGRIIELFEVQQSRTSDYGPSSKDYVDFAVVRFQPRTSTAKV